MERKPLILVTNDDSVDAPGIHALAEAVRPLGEVVVVAPDKPQSAKSHAITMDVPLYIRQVDFGKGITAYKCSGTPVDCVKLAKDKILDRLPDICLSGINHGANCSINIVYSGTMGAAMEAAIAGVPSIGFSLLDHSLDADFSLAKIVAFQLTTQALEWADRSFFLLNVNIPKIDQAHFKGIKVCRQANGKWIEEFDKTIDSHGEECFWMTGKFCSLDNGDDTDLWALQNNYASVVPVQSDQTHYSLKKELEMSWSIKSELSTFH